MFSVFDFFFVEFRHIVVVVVEKKTYLANFTRRFSIIPTFAGSSPRSVAFIVNMFLKKKNSFPLVKISLPTLSLLSEWGFSNFENFVFGVFFLFHSVPLSEVEG